MADIRGHQAFSFDYPVKAAALYTPMRLFPASLNVPFDGKRQFIEANALWDTGATSTMVTHNIARKMSLPQIDTMKITGVNSMEEKAPVYILDLLIPPNIAVMNTRVAAGNIGDDIDILIGMDIIQMGDFNISNAGGKTKFSWCVPPHDNPVNLVEKSNKVNERLKRKTRS